MRGSVTASPRPRLPAGVGRLPRLTALALLAGCHDALPSRATPVTVAFASAEPNGNNALALWAHIRASGADSGRVIYWAGSGSARDTTPFSALDHDGAGDLPVLGLTASTGYQLQVQVKGHEQIATSGTFTAATPQLPAPLSDLHLQVTGSIPPGLLITSLLSFNADSVGYALAFDPSGQLRWYREFREGITGMPVIETKQQPNGNFTAYVGPTGRPPLLTRYYEFTPAGQIVREYRAPAPFYLDNHELLLTFDAGGLPTAHFFAFDFRHVDSFPPASKGDTSIAGHRLIRQRFGAEPEIIWNSWDHFAISDVIEPGSSYAIDHPNSIAFDLDSNYIVSWRNLGEITKIHARTGAIMWRMGGAHNQFTFVDDPLNGFSGQHSPRVLPNGDLLFFDNGWRHTPSETRAVEYKIDAAKRTATLVWEYRHSPTIFTPYVGSVQRQLNGNTLIGYGLAARIVEVTNDKSVVFEATLMNGSTPLNFYRAIRVPSLYHFAAP